MVTATVETAVAVTWSVNITRMTTELIAEELSSITQTDDGKIWIVWAKAVLGDRTLYYKTSSDLGTTWSEEGNLTYIPETIIGTHDTSPSIIQAANGTIWLVWASNRPYSPPSGPDFTIDALVENLTIPQGGSQNSTITITSMKNFSEPVTLSLKKVILGVNTAFDPNPATPPPDATVNSTLTISIDPAAPLGNHTLTVLGKTENKTRNVTISLEITESGMAPLSEPSSSNSTPSSGGGIDWEIYYKTSNDNGATWSRRIPLTNNTVDDLRPSIIQLTNGTLMIVYGTEQGIPVTDSDIFYNTTSDGTSWTYGNITANPGFDKGASIMQAEDERIWVAWASDRTGDYEVFGKTYDVLLWSNATQLTNNTDLNSRPSMLQAIDGTLMMFFQSRGTSPNAHADIYYKSSVDNGVNWSDRVQFTTDNNEDFWPSVTQSRDTTIWVAWTSNRADQPDGNWDIYYKTSLVGDVNGDGVVDIYDLSICGQAYGSVVGEPEYNPDADFNHDGLIDIRDIAIVSRNFGST